jgi:quinol monooxygenase YgiN
MAAAHKVFVVAEVRAKKDFIEEVKRECIALVEPSRVERGCITYHLHEATDDTGLFIFVESWESREDLENHLESQHSYAFDAKTSEMLAEPERITYLKRIV